MLLTEFDPTKTAVIDPGMMFHRIPDFPETLVSIFSHQLFNKVLEFLGGEQIACTQDVDGIWPVYAVTYQGKRFAYYKARLGAPACVGCFEDVIPMGVKRIILLGESVTALAVAALFIPGRPAAGLGLFAIGLGNGPVFPNMSHLTPIHFGKAVSQSFMGVELASAYSAFMVTPLLFSLIAQTVGVSLFPAACLTTFVLTAAATALMARHTGKGRSL